ncbi:glycoside hydrolase family 3 protein [Candidatus Paraluminiphilus aquimaris]|uniref:glycoside hydrolase family 3 protein n=1 Tax=Candidatus Paraluminiphilus aquimaris TaxID=2518994 RepID=UPI002432CE33|nr:glycoside hydrolase family 3 N-terminal domain-containing protein [Candidatus Paraluminiphilus aquimaris]
MKTIIKLVVRVLIIAVVVAALYAANLFLKPISKMKASLAQSSIAPSIRADGEAFRDLNRNGSLDPYEDYRIATADRVEDLLSQMTLEEKVGQMFHPPVLVEPDPLFRVFLEAMNAGTAIEELITRKSLTHFNFYGGASPENIAKRLNELQQVAERTRLGIPLSISSDPVHEVPRGGGIASFTLSGVSKWPSQLGFAAGRDASMLEAFGKIAAAEYRAMGFTTALHPMSDMATEPRWARNFGTFGSNAALSAEMTVAYMKGFQGESLSNRSVMTMVKHFPGGGPQLDGLDPHLKSGESQVYPGNNFDYHLAPFIAAIENDMRVVMPYYGIPTGQTDEDVAMAFNRYILTDLLRDELGFEGVICTDWGVITGRIWGVEPLTVEERYLKSIEAGVDQYGGESEPEYIVDLVNQGVISEVRIDESVRRILKNKFDLGLFESPFVDETAVEEAVNLPQYVALGMTAQRNAVVLLDNGSSALPLAAETRIFVDGLEPSVAANYGTVVDTPEQADVVLLFLNTVFNGNQPAGTDSTFDQMMATRFPDTNLAFSDEILAKAASYSDVSQLVTLVDLNRPAVLTELKGMSGALVGTFGVSDEAMLDILFGKHNPVGKLPFELPSSMAEVEAQLEDVPDDTANPLFPYGWGLSYQ